jgi:VanZ family protein
VAYRIKYYSPAILYVILIAFLSSLDQRIVATYSWGIRDFILHGIEYNLLGVTFIWAVFRDKHSIELRASYRLAVSLGVAIAIADEFYQSFVPSRFSTIEDVVADSFGVILSILTFKLLMKISWLERYRRHA